jgi:cysteine desulfurase|tara:strand:- start:708 stop:1856 length:1149 start_codon:yes stop_codon:yes gene_type:complete
MNKIYFDNAATTEISEKVISEMMKAMKVNYGNPSSTHSHGRNSKAILELSRKTIAEKFNVNPKEIIFTSGGTESNNMIIKTVVIAQNIERIISTKIEHKAVLNSIESIAKERGITILFLDVDEYGLPNKQQLIEYLENSDEKTLVSLMHINNETGTMIDLEEFGKICKSNNALFHSDTVQTIGHYNIDLDKINIDFMTCSAHKFHGPKGVGFAYIKNGQTVKPFIEGGAQERGYRGGTESIHNIVGLKTAIDISYENLENDSKKVKELKDHFIKTVMKRIPETKINGKHNINESSYAILNLCLPINSDKKTILNFKLDLAGISCSSGSACQSGSSQPSHVLSEMLSDDDMKKISLRFSFSKFNTIKEVNYVVEFLKNFVEEN